jgi:hypothetical protein
MAPILAGGAPEGPGDGKPRRQIARWRTGGEGAADGQWRPVVGSERSSTSARPS